MNQTTKNTIKLFLNRFIRISDTIKWSAISFLGFILSITQLSITTYIIPFLIFALSTFCIMGFTFAVNNFYDIQSDIKNPRRKETNVLASGDISRRSAIFYSLILALIPLLLSIFTFRYEIFIFCSYLLFLGWTYSAPPFRTKNIPGLDLIWHFIGFFSFVIWGSLIAGSSIYAGSIGLMIWLIAISIGVFSCIGQVWNHIMDYSFDKPDFNFRQFRSNLVIRWEYTPGSTVYFVWSQNRTGDDNSGDFSFRNDMNQLFEVYPHDVFLIKINRWFSL